MDTRTVETMASFATSSCDATEIDPTLVTIVKRAPVAPLPPAFAKAKPKPTPAPAPVAPPPLLSLADPNDMPTTLRPVPDEVLADAAPPIAERLACARSDYPRYDPAAMKLPPPLPRREEQKPVDDAAAFAVAVMHEALQDAPSLASILEPDEAAPPSLPVRERLRMLADDLSELLGRTRERAQPLAAPALAFTRRWGPYAIAGAVVGLVVAVSITKLRDAIGGAAPVHETAAVAHESAPAPPPPTAVATAARAPRAATPLAAAAEAPPAPLLRLPMVTNPTPYTPPATPKPSVASRERRATASARAVTTPRAERVPRLAPPPSYAPAVAAAPVVTPAASPASPGLALAPMPAEYAQAIR